jgi:hypothetical protein
VPGGAFHRYIRCISLWKRLDCVYPLMPKPSCSPGTRRDPAIIRVENCGTDMSIE